MTLPPFCHCPVNSILHGKPKKNNIFLYNVFSVSSCSMRTGHALPKSKHLSGPQNISWEMKKVKAVLAEDLFLTSGEILGIDQLFGVLFCCLMIITPLMRPFNVLVFKE